MDRENTNLLIISIAFIVVMGGGVLFIVSGYFVSQTAIPIVTTPAQTFRQTYSFPAQQFNPYDQFSKTISDMTLRIEEDPEDVEAYRKRGLAYKQLTDFESAMDMWGDILQASDTTGSGLKVVFHRRFFEDTRKRGGRFCRARPDEVRRLRSLTTVLLYLLLDCFHGELRWTVQSLANRLALSRRKPSQVRAALEKAVADIAAATHDPDLGDYRIVFDRKGRLAHIRRVHDEDVRSWEAVTRFGQWEDVVRWAEQNP